MTRRKPDPEAYQLALKKLRLSARSAVAIEDSPSGLSSARAAGIRRHRRRPSPPLRRLGRGRDLRRRPRRSRRCSSGWDSEAIRDSRITAIGGVTGGMRHLFGDQLVPFQGFRQAELSDQFALGHRPRDPPWSPTGSSRTTSPGAGADGPAAVLRGVATEALPRLITVRPVGQVQHNRASCSVRSACDEGTRAAATARRNRSGGGRRSVSSIASRTR